MDRQPVQVVRYPANDFIRIGTLACNGCRSASEVASPQ